MAKSREGKDDEFYKGELRKLRAENRSLKKRLHQLERSKHVYEDSLLNEDDPNEVQSQEPKCPDCFKGNLVNTDMGPGTLISCTNCIYRKFVRNGK